MNRYYNIKLKAGALQYAIFISVIIALLIFSFISLTYVQQQLSAKNEQFQELVEVVDEAFLSVNLKGLNYNIQTELTSISDDKNKLKAIKQPWGVFDIVSLTGVRNNEVFTKTALLAGHQLKQPALYLQDENQPLVLVGDTKIEGDVALPKQGVKRGTIVGNSYSNNQLVYGSITKSSNRLPSLVNLQALKKIEIEFLSNNLTDAEAVEDEMRLVNSFSNPTKILASTGSIDLRGVHLTGNIMVQAGDKIKVDASSQLTDVILMAPEIEIGSHLIGNFQAIASKNITVAQNCSLTYPSSLILLEKPRNMTNEITKTSQISIATGSNIKGIVAFISSTNTESYDTHIRIEKDATVTGEIYCNQNMELQGTVNGSVYTRGFITNQFGSVYKNHIYNGKISSKSLPKQYAGLQFKGSNQKTAKWIYY